MIFCRRFRACSGLGSPSFVVMIRRMCGFTSPSRSASRVRPLGAGLLPGSPPWGVSRRALRQAGPFAGLSAGACVPGPALRRRPLAGSPPWGVSRRALRQAEPFSGSFGRSVYPGSGSSASAFCRGLRRGACLAAHSGRRDPSAVLSAGACVPGPALRRRPLAGSPPWGVSRRALRQAEPFSGSFGRSVYPGSGSSASAFCRGLRRGACLAAHSGRRDPSRVFPPERPLEARPSA